MTRRWLPWALCGLALATVAGCAVLDVLDRARLHTFDDFQPTGLVIGVSFTLLGTLVVLRRPDNRIGWIYLLIGVLQPVQSLAALYYEHSVISGAAGGRWAAWVNDWASLPVFPTGLALFAFLLFPSGRLPSRRWRPVAAAAIAVGVVLGVVTLLDPAPIEVATGFPKVANLTGVAAVGTGVYGLSGFVYAFGIALIATAIGGLVVRVRRAATQEERQQVKLVALAASVTIGALSIASIINLAGIALSDTVWAIPIVFGFGIAVPAAFGFAILKHGLYEIDRVISRTLSYALLTGLLVGVFVGLVLLTTRVLPFSSPVGVAASTLAAAGLFSPLRNRLQRLVDRRFNRADYDAEAIAAAFGARLRDTVDPETVLTELAAAAGGSLQPAHLSVWVKAS